MTQQTDVGRDTAALQQLADELFITTDMKDWQAARKLFADGPLAIDMSSLVGGEPVRMTADQLIAGFRAGLHEGKASHHMATNYRTTVQGDNYSKLTRGADAVGTHSGTGKL